MQFESFHLAASTPNLDAEPAARPHADLLEFRMDLAADPLSALAAYDGELPIMVTNRPEWEGGEHPDGPERRDQLLEALSEPAVAAVDLELRALEEPTDRTDLGSVLDRAQERGLPVVVSVHDFERVPSRATLLGLAQRGCRLGSVAKLAMTATDPGDVLDLLAATQDLTTCGHTVATMAMGATGAHSRAIAPLYGSKIGYAPIDPEAATAPGQFDLATLDGLLETFGVERPADSKV
ncbi:type I 3-dehydroquinate dehydratase [Halodesulfurarchaeum sp. HSR-GB]|uniref:type I 3-dehydroquinate dehydratase n=1 Tax=Halodesulfurarchaeum sp. HSR-GB TaxID=3074077 RepID=UPI00285E84ED|nr:type I 3-dehydroquinate dehydratase [Halodesulfurarchaeum sp. HSR-GB]MDR5656788.1 type I 3-dehydroquinate dehydratase [Halodesulfurarchaeum sp. HSR-GB]